MRGPIPASASTGSTTSLAALRASCTDTFFAGWEPVESSLPGYRYLDLSVPFETAELMVHPGQGEAWREKELDALLSARNAGRAEDIGLELSTFAQLC